ncbi:MAG: inositol monophosphatase [Acidobacteria bacterium]|nr:inositol monophosphatase [Acidobacteriota bacterium]
MPVSVFLATAIEIVTRAGQIQLERRESGFRISKKGETDLVTEVDLECEHMCRAVIAERFPDHDVLAEELGAGPTAGRGSRWRWVFDPLDGTTNYAHGVPIFCASLGLEIDGRTAVGAVYDPTRSELFTAERARGAYLNGKRLTVSDTPTLIDALIVTGFPYDVHQHAGDLVELFGAFLGQARAVRRLGSAALDLCYVAAGRFGAFWEQHLKPWDVVAGALIVEEAGGRVTGMNGLPFDVAAAHLVASNGRLHDEMLTVIREFRAGRTETGRTAEHRVPRGG